MTLRSLLVAPALVMAGVVIPTLGARPIAAPVAADAPQGQTRDQSTLDDQTDLALTVYNGDLALVRDVRTLRVPRGVADLRFMDIAATVNPATVHLRSLSEPQRLSVLEQNYEYDLLEPEKLLRKYVGREVTLVRSRQVDGKTVEEAVTATLLSYNQAPVWRIGGEIVTGYRADHIKFPEVPGNLYSRPTLVWALSNQGAVQHRVEASYLAGGLSWNADYVLTVTRDDRLGDLDGWVTLRNTSGTTFNNASLQLVAGSLNRVRDGMMKMAQVARENAMPAAAPMQEEAFGEYHLYTLDRKTSLNQNQTKQVSLLGANGIPVIKRYVVEGQSFYYRNPQHPGAPLKDDVQVFYQLPNNSASGLGMPMPAGTVRVYQADTRGGVQFVGEDHIGHTPKDETLNLKIGTAFDVVAERKQTDFQRIAPNTFELEYEVVLRNHKSAPVTVEVNEPIGGTWRMVRSSHTARKTDAWAAQFQVPVAADGASTLTYRVRVTY